MKVILQKVVHKINKTVLETIMIQIQHIKNLEDFNKEKSQNVLNVKKKDIEQLIVLNFHIALNACKIYILVKNVIIQKILKKECALIVVMKSIVQKIVLKYNKEEIITITMVIMITNKGLIILLHKMLGVVVVIVILDGEIRKMLVLTQEDGEILQQLIITLDGEILLQPIIQLM